MTTQLQLINIIINTLRKEILLDELRKDDDDDDDDDDDNNNKLSTT